MQIDSDTAAIVGVFSGILSSVIAFACGYGFTKAKIESMDINVGKIDSEVRELRDAFVKSDHFTDVVEPLQEAIGEMQKDIKQILLMLRDR